MPGFRLQISTNELSLFLTHSCCRHRLYEDTNHGLLAGSSLRSNFPIAMGWCSPVPPTKVYVRSKPLVLPLSFSSCHLRETRQLTPATLPACHSARVQ